MGEAVSRDQGVRQPNQGGASLRARASQPIILVLLGAVFVSLFLGLSILNWKRLEATLYQVQASKAISIVEGVERAARELFSSLGRMEGAYDAVSASSALSEEGLSAHEFLVSSIIDVARDLDAAEEKGGLSSQDLAEMARSLRLLSIVFLNERAEMGLHSGPLPQSVLQEARSLMDRGEGVSLMLLPGRVDPGSVPFVVLRRRSVPGVVVITLGEEDLTDWRMRASLQEAIEVAGWRKGVIYFAVEDSQGRILARAGEVSQAGPEATGLGPSQVLGDASMLRREVMGQRVVEVSVPFRLGDTPLGQARLGLDSREVDELLSRNRLQIYLSTGMITLLALLAVVLLYTTQIRHQRRLREVQERLYQAERLSALGRLAGVVAHEVRNPLNAISMAVQRLGRQYAPSEGSSREEFSRMIQVLRDEIQRINRIIEEFLGLTRKGRLRIQEIPVREILDRLRTLVEPQATSGSVELRVEGDGEDLSVMVDRDRIMQALLNLLSNAMEAMPPEGGVVSLSYRPHGKDRALIQISDTGKGILPEEMDKIFDLGYTTKGKGLGLGLHVAREIVELHGGSVDVRSEKGKGTVFSVYLPAR
jgi:signal transduction histidine kinase